MSQAVLLPYQQRWVADSSDVKICEKSRRVGLSWAEASDCALTAARQTGMDCWYIGYNKDMAQEFIRDVAFWAKNFGIASEYLGEEVLKDEDKDILTFVVKFASGNRVTALSSRPSNLRGKQGVVVIDEAAFHDDLEGLVKAAMALLIWGGKVRIISTHLGVDNPFNALIQDVRADKLPYTVHRIPFDEAVQEGLFKRICVAQGKEWRQADEDVWVAGIRALYSHNAAEELDCVPSNSSGAYLSRALIESRMSADSLVLRYTCGDGFEQQTDAYRAADAQGFLDDTVQPVLNNLSKTARSSIGLDFGRSGDLSVLTVLLESQGLERRCPFMVEMRNVPFRQQEQILFGVIDRLPRFNYGALDARGNGQYLAEVAMQRYGAASIDQVMLTQQWYLENMPRLKAALEDGDLAALPKDSDVLDDLRAITVVKGIPRLPDGKTQAKGGLQRHGDSAISLALAWFASTQGGGMFEYIAVPNRPPPSANRPTFRMRPETAAASGLDFSYSRKDW
jgi:phage FluMu gp28-like protein